MTATYRLAKSRMMLDDYMREAAEVLALRQMELGDRIRKARKDKGWKQKHLAGAVHVEPLTVSRWERGQHTPPLETLELIAQETGKPLSFFLDPPKERAEDDPVSARLDAIESEIRELRQAVEGLVVDVRRLGAVAP